MTEHRCLQCEALITEVECLDCVWNSRHQNASVITRAPQPKAPQCRNGHEMTEANTRLEARAHCIARVCRTCNNQRIVKSRARRKALAEEQ